MPRQVYRYPIHVVARAQQRETRLVGLGYESYGDYLRSSAWRALRRRYAEERPWLCHICGAEQGLHLHHRTYERVGREELDDLMPLCAGCHDLVHDLERRGEAGLDFAGVIDAVAARRNRLEMERVAAEREAELEAFEADFVAHLATLSFAQRLALVRSAATLKGLDITRDLWMFHRLIRGGCKREAERRFVRLELRVHKARPQR